MSRYYHSLAACACILLSALVLSGCAAVDASYLPRTNFVTRNVGDQRDSNTFNNIVRASRHETLNFTALSKYTANGTLQLNSNFLTRQFTAGAALPGDTFGPNNAMGTVTNSFDLGSLENHDFYKGLMSPISPTTIDFLLSSGLSRELVMHAVIESVEFKTREGQSYRVYNDPSNDAAPAGTAEADKRQACDGIFTDTVINPHRWFDTNLATASQVGKKDTSCGYQKFRYLLRYALQHGLTTRNIDFSTNEKATSSKKEDSTTQKQTAHLCFDASLAERTFYTVDARPKCSTLTKETPYSLLFDRRTDVTDAVPYFRSTYGVFLYLGSVLGDTTAEDRARIVQGPTEDLIFPVTASVGDCFVEAQGFCIQNGKQAANARQLLTLLNVLVALNVNPAALPITPSVQFAPGL